MFFQDLTNNQPRIIDGNNRIYYSEGYKYYSEDAFRAVSIKMPLTGTLHYRSQYFLAALQPGSMLLTCKQPGKAFFDEEESVRSICIDINEQVFSAAVDSYFRQHEKIPGFLPSYFQSPHLFWNTYFVKGSELERSLLDILSAIKDDDTGKFNENTFQELALQVIRQEHATVSALHNLRSVKSSTKKEVLQRLMEAKRFMDEQFLRNPEVAEIAAISNLSQFHFFRSFKQAYGITPYQYMLSKRLAHAKMLMETNTTVIKAARHCNFTDIFSFSKSFKKHYGFPPSVVTKGR